MYKEYKEYLKELKNNLEDLKDDLLDDKKLMHIPDDKIMEDVSSIELSIENIENLLSDNNRI